MDVQRIKGACSETLIISLLRDEPMHGYEMCKQIEQRSQGYFQLKHSTLYPLLHKLEKRGLIKGVWGDFDSGKPRKSYRLTRKGATFYRDNAAMWRQLFSTMALLVPEVAG